MTIREFTKEALEDFNAGHEFVVDDPVLLAAKKAFKVEYLFPWQRLVIGNIMDSYSDWNENRAKKLQEDFAGEKDFSDAFCLGRQIVLLPTGAGKSMCFLVPSIMLDGPTLIIYPLLALMTDQERRMQQGGIQSVTFKGGQTQKEREDNFKALQQGARIILANPEVLLDDRLVERLKTCGISHIAIDEAHCTSEWGDTFRPAYLELGKVIKKLGVQIVTAFTATASPSVLDRISQVLFDGNAHVVRSESDRPNIHYYVEYACNKPKAVMRLAATEQKPMIVFCGTRVKAESMARLLREVLPQDQVRFYHAGLSKEEKSATEKWFFNHKSAVLMATCAYGMGVDKSDIRTVVHLEPSPTAESYIQEAGRGGRDRQVAKAILLWSPEDSRTYAKYEKGSRERVLKEFAESKSCRRQVLLDALGGEQAVCSGCDICEGSIKRSPQEAEDSLLALKYIRQHTKLFDKTENAIKIKEKLNKRDLKYYGINIWDVNDVLGIIGSLMTDGLIKTMRWFWPEKIMAVKPAALIKQKKQKKGERKIIPRLLRYRPLVPLQQGQQEQERRQPSSLA
ncbi:MAG: RecQ family ATP-dependent DNA helicase [Treponema sp.]|nr:RecQ family ATP-dependent DNA helicase [Treponema sp.]